MRHTASATRCEYHIRACSSRVERSLCILLSILRKVLGSRPNPSSGSAVTAENIFLEGWWVRFVGGDGVGVDIGGRQAGGVAQGGLTTSMYCFSFSQICPSSWDS